MRFSEQLLLQTTLQMGSFIKWQTSDTSSDTGWQRVTTNDSEWSFQQISRFSNKRGTYHQVPQWRGTFELRVETSPQRRIIDGRKQEFRQFFLCDKYNLTLSLPEKLKNWIFEMPIIPQTLNINNSRTTRAKSINLHTIRKLIECSFKKVQGKGNVYSCRFRDIDVRR